ncbi:hypothetical protein QVD17_04957 [Tagetes erecta]|uniref:AP complex mu/sigma subunit domain-containing protein n=1 Tax=Tagetes erecta TaxID=13708 RepID=A0AAD8PB49_TARER|nr:hypothetical protein QVD17_04957 [Tagetes erecta]
MLDSGSWISLNSPGSPVKAQKLLSDQACEWTNKIDPIKPLLTNTLADELLVLPLCWYNDSLMTIWTLKQLLMWYATIVLSICQLYILRWINLDAFTNTYIHPFPVELNLRIMIRAVIVINNQGKPRLCKFYTYTPVEQQQQLIRSIYSVLCLQPENVTNFIPGGSILGPDLQLVYKLFATLYFVFVFDSSENELAMFDLIQVYVGTLEKCFSNVCEVDIVLNYSKMHTILDEMILGGQVVETNSETLMQAVEEISKLEKITAATKLISKSASLLWG